MRSDMFSKYAMNMRRAIVLSLVKRPTDTTLDGNSTEVSSVKIKITGLQPIQYARKQKNLGLCVI